MMTIAQTQNRISELSAVPVRDTVRRMALDAEIKFRCTDDLAARFERIAKLERRNPSDLARIVYEDYVRQQERALGLLLQAEGLNLPTTARRRKRKARSSSGRKQGTAPTGDTERIAVRTAQSAAGDSATPPK